MSLHELEHSIKEKLTAILDERHCYLVELNVKPNKVEVFADSDPRITIEDCAIISKTLSKELDKEFSFSERFALEVSSPGMGEPLKVLRQYRKSMGRQVEILLVSGMKKEGTLMFADEEKILIEEKSSDKNKNIPSQQTEIPFLQIKSTKIIFNF